MKRQLFKSFIAFSILNSAFCIHSNAQIVYTDVNPDDTISCNTVPCTMTYNLDLNNDAVNDFRFSVSYASNGVCVIYPPPPPPFPNTYPRRLLTASVLPVNTGFYYGINTTHPLALSFGNSIVNIPNWNTTSGILYSRNFHYTNCPTNTTSGNWNSTTDRYLPVKFISSGNNYFGWIKMNIYQGSSISSIRIIVKEYAYNSVANQPIIAGQTTTTTGINETYLSSNISIFPNPLSHSTTINFHLLKKDNISLKIFDMNGRLIKTLADNNFEQGEHSIEWNAEKVNAGIYFLKMQAGEFLKTEKLIITKQF